MKPSGPAGTVADDAAPAGSVAALRSVALARFTVAMMATVVGVVGAGEWDRRLGALFLVIGLLWLPWTAVLLAASVRPGRTGRQPPFLQRAPFLYGGPAGDVVVVFVAQFLVPGVKGIALLADAVVLSVAAAAWRGRPAGTLLGASVGLTLVAQGATPVADRVSAAVLASSFLALTGLVVLVARIARIQRQESVRSRRLQQKAETIVARVADGIVVTDGDGVIVECNPAGERLIGGSGRRAVGMPCARTLALRAGERVLDCSHGCPLVEPGATSETSGGREVWRTHPDGRRQPLLASAFAVSNDRGGVDVVHSLRDITRLKEADEAKTLFLATASHELKTPATVIAGFADAIRRYPAMPAERRDEAIEAIHRRALELAAIVDRLLLSSKIEGGRVAVDVHDLDVRPLLNERAVAMQDATGRHVIVQVAPERMMAAADGLALRTIIDYLLDNAVKYSDGGPVVLGAHRDASTVSLWVSDVGIGMDEEQAGRCFDKFWQAESTDVRRFGGTGIGLYIVKSLVDAMGARITVETSVGRGSTFRVELPAAARTTAGGSDGADLPGFRDLVRHLGVLQGGPA